MGTDYPKLAFIEPDYRFFVDTGQTAEETIALVFKVLEKFESGSQSVWEFVNSVYKSYDVVFAFFYGSALNINLEPFELEDVDVFVATRNKKFVYDWNQPKGTEIRYLFVTEIKNYLKVEKKFFLPVFSNEYNALGGVFANGLLVIKFSEELQNIIQGVRQNFNKIHVKALSQIVENDCKKRVEKRRFIPHQKRRYSFYGSEKQLTFDEARLMIDESVKRKNIQPNVAPAIVRSILKRIKTRSVYKIHRQE